MRCITRLVVPFTNLKVMPIMPPTPILFVLFCPPPFFLMGTTHLAKYQPIIVHLILARCIMHILFCICNFAKKNLILQKNVRCYFILKKKVKIQFSKNGQMKTGYFILRPPLLNYNVFSLTPSKLNPAAYAPFKRQMTMRENVPRLMQGKYEHAFYSGVLHLLPAHLPH